MNKSFIVRFLRFGVLPPLLLVALVVFSLLSEQFLTTQNIVNLLRQSVYLVLISAGQMFALITGGFDLSVGTIVALTSVVSTMVMTAFPDLGPGLSILLGCVAGIMAALSIGLINGFGVAYIGVSPFIMTLAMQSIGFGFALYLTGGVPVSGLPEAFSNLFGFGRMAGIPISVWVALAILIVIYLMMTRTVIGTYLLAVGGNVKAARLSGINDRSVLLFAYLMCGVLAGVAGLLLTARVGSGEANLGGTVALESIAACVIAGVSLRGGRGTIEAVVLGAIFIGLVQNGLNLLYVNSYVQMMVIGFLLIIAVVSDSLRHRLGLD